MTRFAGVNFKLFCVHALLCAVVSVVLTLKTVLSLLRTFYCCLSVLRTRPIGNGFPWSQATNPKKRYRVPSDVRTADSSDRGRFSVVTGYEPKKRYMVPRDLVRRERFSVVTGYLPRKQGTWYLIISVLRTRPIGDAIPLSQGYGPQKKGACISYAAKSQIATPLSIRHK